MHSSRPPARKLAETMKLQHHKITCNVHARVIGPACTKGVWPTRLAYNFVSYKDQEDVQVEQPELQNFQDKKAGEEGGDPGSVL